MIVVGSLAVEGAIAEEAADAFHPADAVLCDRIMAVVAAIASSAPIHDVGRDPGDYHALPCGILAPQDASTIVAGRP